MKERILIPSATSLPPLTKKLNKREAKITPKVNDWFFEHYLHGLGRDYFIEVKATETDSLAKSSVKSHQLKKLKAIRSTNGLKHKLSDAGRIRQVVDCFGIAKKDSFVVACFLKERVCLAIEPDKWEGAKVYSPCSFKFDL